MSITPYVPPAFLTGLPRGNLLLQSQSFNVTWTTLAASIAANTTTDPNGLTTADTLTRTATTSSNVSQALTKAASSLQYTLSLYVQAGTGSFVAVRAQGASSANRADACFNLLAGTVSSAASVTGGFSAASATITPITGAWYRVTLTFTTDTATTLNLLISSSSVSQQTDGTGSANSTTAFLWGAQLETGAVASNYAATTTAADPGIWAGTSSLNVLPFLPGQAIAVSKAPLWSTKVVRAASGRERRTAFWPY